MTGWVWINERTVLAVHDRALLQSALARPQQIAAYGENADLIDLAAALTRGIVKNHPFVDGNKRTGFVAGVLFLEINGATFSATEEAAANAVLALAAGELDETGYATFLRANTSTQT